MTTPTEGAERWRCEKCLSEYPAYPGRHRPIVNHVGQDWCYGHVVKEVAHVEWREEPEMDRLNELAAVMRKGMFPEALDDWNECGPIIKKQWQSSAKAALRWLDEDAHRRVEGSFDPDHVIYQALGFERTEYADATEGP